jgi:Protein of unknown function (DUF1579)
MTRTWGLVVSLTVMTLVVGFATADDKPKEFPTEQHKQLDVLVGTWDVAVTFKIGGQERQGKSTCETKWVLDGKHLHQQYQSSMNGRPFTVVQILGYDANRKKFFELKLDSMDTGVMHNEGTISADGKTLSMRGERVDPMTGQAGKMRTVTTIADKDHYTLEWYLTGADGKEEKTVTLVHTRKK